MIKTYIFPMGEVVACVETTLEPYLGVVARYCNHHALIEATLNLVFLENLQSGHCFIESNAPGREPAWASAAQTPYDILSDYGLPTDIVHEVVGDVRTALLRMISCSVGQLCESKEYRCRVNLYGDVEIIVTEPRARGPLKSDEDLLIEQVREGLNNGDWYPEKIRRLVGWS